MADTGFDWFLLEGPTFLQAEVCEITGATAATLQNWANRGLLDAPAQGKGSRRSYSAGSVAAILYAQALIAAGTETFLALSVGMSAQVAVLRKYKAAVKGGASADETAEELAHLAALVIPDREKFKHQIDLIDVRNIGPDVFGLAVAGVFLPIGPMLTQAITAALKVKMPQPERRLATMG